MLRFYLVVQFHYPKGKEFIFSFIGRGAGIEHKNIVYKFAVWHMAVPKDNTVDTVFFKTLHRPVQRCLAGSSVSMGDADAISVQRHDFLIAEDRPELVIPVNISAYGDDRSQLRQFIQHFQARDVPGMDDVINIPEGLKHLPWQCFRPRRYMGIRYYAYFHLSLPLSCTYNSPS